MASSQNPPSQDPEPRDRQPADAGEALERLGRLSLRDLTMEDLLQTVAGLHAPGSRAGRAQLPSVPLAIDVDEQVRGALNLYAREADAFDADARAAAVRFGPYAAVAAGTLHAYRSARDRTDNLQTALASRAVIDQAKGVLIERFRLTPDQAFQVLAQASMHANRKVRDIAEELVHTGELPAVAPRAEAKRSRPRPPSGRPGRGTPHDP